MSATAAAKESDRISVRIGPKTRQTIEAIKKQFDYKSDAEVFRHALGTQARIGESIARGEKIFVGDEEGNLLKELVFISPA